jgi:hypothetical protein
VILRLLLGPLHPAIALVFHSFFFLGAFLSEVTLASISLARLFLVLEPVQFCNLNHEFVYKRLVVFNICLAALPIAVDLIFQYGNTFW